VGNVELGTRGSLDGSLPVGLCVLKSFYFLVQVGGRGNLLLRTLGLSPSTALCRGLGPHIHSILLVDVNLRGIDFSALNLRILQGHDLTSPVALGLG